MAVLSRTVLAHGKVYAAGTPERPDLREKIPARFWDAPGSGVTDDAADDPGPAPEPDPDSAPPEPGPARTADGGAYDGLRVADLNAEIDRRNTSRDGGARAPIVPAGGRRADLIAALVADDADTVDGA